MQSIPFPGATLQIGKGQPEYNIIHAMPVGGPQGEVIACFELTDVELEQIIKTRKVYYSRWTFNQPFQPMRLFVEGIGTEPQPEETHLAGNGLPCDFDINNPDRVVPMSE